MTKAGKIASKLNVHPDTVRLWVDTFEEFFSANARKGAGIRRAFTFDDETVINTIHELRKQKIDMEEIRARLKNNERISVLPAVNEPLPETAVEIYGKMRELELTIDTQRAEIDRLRAENKSEREEAQLEIRRLDRENAVLQNELNKLREAGE